MAVSAVIRDAEARVLLVRRGQSPNQGLWSLPGGKVEPGETLRAAMVRELAEETGLTGRDATEVLARVVKLTGVPTYEIHVFRLMVESGAVATAGDDADEVGWFDQDGLAGLQVTDGLRELLVELADNGY